MLKFLTHKLRTHSLNEDVPEKVEERDSGTESDDEADRVSRDSCTDVVMKWSDVTDIKSCECACGGDAHCVCTRAPHPPDLLYDHHSSEEELEVINGAEGACAGAEGGARGSATESRRRGASSPPPAGAGAAPEKRKWARDRGEQRLASDDDEDTKVETPVRFRTSPPLEALKPRRSGAGPVAAAAAAECGCGTAAVTPRRRRPPAPPPRRHRPALDFDKMQQLRVGGAGVRWRGAGGAGGELSVFCW